MRGMLQAQKMLCGRGVVWPAEHSPRDPVGGQRQSTAQNQQDCKD